VMDFGASSPQLPACDQGTTDPVGCTLNTTATGGDIRYVGAGSSKGSDDTLENGWMWFGVSTFGDNATLGNSTIPYVDMDVDGDGEPDFEVYVQNWPSTDVLMANLVDLSSGDLVDIEPVNFAFGDVDTNVFDTDSVLIPVWPAAIGVTGNPSSFPITYTVGEYSVYGSPENGGDIDDVGPVSFDVAKPRVAVDRPLWVEDGGSAIDANVKAPNTKSLVLSLDNASGSRAQVVTLNPAVPTAPTGVHATAGNQRATVSWTAPSYHGASAIKGYDVQYSGNGGPWHSASSAFHTSTSTHQTVTGLANGSSYRFRVAAINTNGTGPYSNPSAAVKPAADKTSLLISQSTTITKGRSVPIVARLIDTTTARSLSGQPVSLYNRPDRYHAWTLVGTAHTDSTGHATITTRPSATRQYYWRYSGTAVYAAASSSVMTVTVQ
jgi:hypothetical protein